MEWKKVEAEKRKLIISAKQHAWSNFVSSLGPNDQPKMWIFVKNMVGNGSNSYADGHSIQDNGITYSTPQEKAEVFRNKLGSIHPKNIQID
jgi:hypothetical protein